MREPTPEKANRHRASHPSTQTDKHLGKASELESPQAIKKRKPHSPKPPREDLQTIEIPADEWKNLSF